MKEERRLNKALIKTTSHQSGGNKASNHIRKQSLAYMQIRPPPKTTNRRPTENVSFKELIVKLSTLPFHSKKNILHLQNNRSHHASVHQEQRRLIFVPPSISQKAPSSLPSKRRRSFKSPRRTRQSSVPQNTCPLQPEQTAAAHNERRFAPTPLSKREHARSHYPEHLADERRRHWC